MKLLAFRNTLAAVALVLAPSAQADPSFGLGLTILFDGSVAVGAKVFSTDDPESAAVSLGLDYNIRSNSLRPNAGLAYLDCDFYVDLNTGFSPQTQGIDFGIGVGGLTHMQSCSPFAFRPPPMTSP